MSSGTSLAARRTARWFVLASIGTLAVPALQGCKPGPTCSPADIEWEVHVWSQGAEAMNPDPQGKSLPTTVRIYQLDDDAALPGLDFEQVWEKGAEAFGGAVIAEQEITLFPGTTIHETIEPAPEVEHIVAVALFREPLGRTWYETYDIPQQHPEAVCAGKLGEPPQALGDPCFFFLLERSQVSGGSSPPAGFDKSAVTMQCAPPPSAYPKPSGDRDERKDKKPKKPSLEKVPSSQPEAPSTPEAPSGPRAPESPSAPEAPDSPA